MDGLLRGLTIRLVDWEGTSLWIIGDDVVPVVILVV